MSIIQIVLLLLKNHYSAKKTCQMLKFIEMISHYLEKRSLVITGMILVGRLFCPGNWV